MLQITENLRIVRHDDKNIVVEYLDTVTGRKDGDIRKEWHIYGYYGKLEQAVLGALDKQLFDSIDEEQTLQDIVARIERARTEILNALKTNNNKI